MNKSVKLTSFNTLHEGRCYTWSMPNIMASYKNRVVKDIYVNLRRNGKLANNLTAIAYIHPASMNAMVVNRWKNPTEPLRVRNSRYIEAKLAKAYKVQLEDEDGGHQCVKKDFIRHSLLNKTDSYKFQSYFAVS